MQSIRVQLIENSRSGTENTRRDFEYSQPAELRLDTIATKLETRFSEQCEPIFSGPKTGGCGPGSIPACSSTGPSLVPGCRVLVVHPSSSNHGKYGEVIAGNYGVVIAQGDGGGSQTFKGTVQRFVSQHGYGFITPGDPVSLPMDVKKALAKQAADAAAMGRSIEGTDALYFCENDVTRDGGAELTAGAHVTFQVRTDYKGPSAFDVSQAI